MHFRPPHPDSIGVGTAEYLQGEKQANLDFKNDNSKFYLVGLINLNSLSAENMRKEFKSKYNIELSFEVCTGGSAYKNGYNNTIKKLVEKKHEISLKKEVHEWIN